MKNRKWMLGLLVLALLLLPSAAWAADVPEVTEDEYRYYLEYMACDVIEGDLSAYSNEELREQIIAFVENVEPYTDSLEYTLWDDYSFEESDFGKYKAEDLEKFMARALADGSYGFETEYLESDYQVSVPENSTPQEIDVLYYQTMLQKDYNITEDMSGIPWYILADKYYQVCYIDGLRKGLGEPKTEYKLAELDALEKQLEIKSIQREYGVTKDLSDYSLEELETLQDRLYAEKEIREDGYTGDLSGYTDEELEELQLRVSIEKDIRDNGYTGDLSSYTVEELWELSERTALEKQIREYGYTGDLSDYTLDELYEMASTLRSEAWEKEWAAEREAAKTKVNVQINGEELYVTEGKDDEWAQYYTYTSDAAPIIKDGRTYIPFRAVFEALGTDVSYNASAKTVTAKRGERTVSFAVGQNQYISNGVTVQMDAQTFVQNGRTFVPVRFASQALGAAVGWDADDRTVVILERDKFINRYKGQFTVLEQYIKHWDFVGEQNLALTGSFNFNMTVTDEDYETGRKTEIPMALTMELQSLTSDTRVNYDAAVKLDLDKLVELAEQEFGPVDEEIMQILSTIKQFRVQYILDIETGTLYLKSELLDLMQGQKNAWYSVALKDYMKTEEYQQYVEMMPQLMDELQKQAEALTVDDVVRIWVEAADINDAYDVSSTVELLDGMYRICGDKNLGKTSEGYVHSVGSEEDSMIGKVTFLTRQDKVAGLQLLLDTTSVLDDEFVCHFKLHEENHVLTLTGNLNVSDMLVLNCDGTWTYTATDEEPIAKPQDGGPIHDLMALLEAFDAAEEENNEDAA